MSMKQKITESYEMAITLEKKFNLHFEDDYRFRHLISDMYVEFLLSISEHDEGVIKEDIEFINYYLGRSFRSHEYFIKNPINADYRKVLHDGMKMLLSMDEDLINITGNKQCRLTGYYYTILVDLTDAYIKSLHDTETAGIYATTCFDFIANKMRQLCV